ncbi:MAG: sulfur carrier protein ThiS adenylyltransferase ThiF [Phycisphaerae bacterium]|nr:sulfur carrier protein ThiS adenylyltransferase ThiF [Phycisphaerae bacterium]
MQIKLNERIITITKGAMLADIQHQYRPSADIIVVNGAPCSENIQLHENDTVSLITRGQTPRPEELEALMSARHTPGVHEIVKKATVGIAGLGGLGSAVAVALARIGVGKLILADFDVVEPSNLNRQQYFIDQIGMPKTQALHDNLKRINPYVDYNYHNIKLTPANIPDIFADVDIQVEAFDVPESKAMIMETFAQYFPDIPLVMASGLAGYEPSNSIQTKRVGSKLIVVGDFTTAAKPGTGLMAPRVGIAAAHQANAVLRLILNQTAE